MLDTRSWIGWIKLDKLDAKFSAMSPERDVAFLEACSKGSIISTCSRV
jgi:hypothetical protein